MLDGDSGSDDESAETSSSRYQTWSMTEPVRSSSRLIDWSGSSGGLDEAGQGTGEAFAGLLDNGDGALADSARGDEADYLAERVAELETTLEALTGASAATEAELRDSAAEVGPWARVVLLPARPLFSHPVASYKHRLDQGDQAFSRARCAARSHPASPDRSERGLAGAAQFQFCWQP